MGSPRASSAIAAAAAVIGLVGCSSTVDLAPPAPGTMLLSPSSLPSGFSPVSAGIGELVDANAEALAVAAKAGVVPAQCRPTADADLNKRLDTDNAAVLAARSADATLSNLVVALARNIDADIAERTGGCATTRTTITEGSRAGAVITAEHRKLTPPQLVGARPGRLGRLGRLDISQMLALRTDTTTTLPDGTTSRSVSFAAYAAARTSGPSERNRYTVSVTVAGDPTPFTKPFPDVSEPMSDTAFLELFSKALAAAGRA